MLRAEEVYNKFFEKWKEFGANLDWREGGDAPWTKAVLDCFKNLGKSEYGLDFMPEYMRLDLVWWRNVGQAHEDYQGLELALESEWGGAKSHIMEDFYKLIDTKAHLKVMVIARSEYSIDELIETMRKTLQNHQIKFVSEEYLIIVFPQSYEGATRKDEVFSGYRLSSDGSRQSLKPYFAVL